jgi:hypothetical protein
MGYTNAGKNLMLDALKGTNPTVAIAYASLHTAAPGESGTSEVTGGSPAYARKSVTFGTPSNGQMAATNQPVFDVPGGTTVTHVGFWSAVSGGTFLGWSDVTDESFAGQGTYTLTSATLDLNA